MNPHPSIPATDRQLWKRYTEAWDSYIAARIALFQQTADKVAVIKAGLVLESRSAALEAARLLGPEDLKRLLPELIGIACYFSGYTQAARELILTIPRDWLKAHIEPYTEPFVLDAEQEADYEVFRGILAIYQGIDKELVLKLANRALAHENADVKEAGSDMLAGLAPEHHLKFK